MQQEPFKKIILIDLFPLIFKSYYTFIKYPLVNSKGQDTGTIFGFFNLLTNLLTEFNPDFIVIASDTQEKTFRHDIYKDYKANRKETPEDLKEQIKIIIEILKSFNFSFVSLDGYEADDVIGTLAEKWKSLDNHKIYIVSEDKDLDQLIQKNVCVINSKRGVAGFVEYGDENIVKKWGFTQDKIVDYLALTGDSSDNIPGAAGIGRITANSLLDEWGSVENIYKNLSKCKTNFRKKLIASKENVFLSKRLIEIKRDLDINISIEESRMPLLSESELGLSYFKEYELAKFIKHPLFKKKNEDTVTSLESEKKILNYKLITRKKDFMSLIEKIHNSPILSIDLESTSLDTFMADIIGVSFCIKENEAYFLPIPYKKTNTFSKEWLKDTKLKNWDMSREWIFLELKKLLEDEKILLIGQNIKYDYLLLKKQENISMRSIYFDTLIASHMLYSNLSRNSLDFLAKYFLNYQTVAYKDLVQEKENLSQVNLNTVKDYACEDSDVAFKLYSLFKKEIDKSAFSKLFYEVEIPLISVLARMEYNGISIRLDYWKKLSLYIDKKIADLESEIFIELGEKFNLNSPKQLSEILFEKRNLIPNKKNKTGSYSTNYEALKKLEKEFPIIKKILQYRKLTKIRTVYLNEKYIHRKTKRMHTEYTQTFTQTGRLSSRNPNLQNIPNQKKKLDIALRKVFYIPRKRVFLCADYSQIELRILAHFSKDPRLIDAFQNNEDIHSITASNLFNKNRFDINEKERSFGKKINFSILYGMGSFSLSKSLNISLQEAKSFIDQYFKIYSGVKDYIEKQKDFLKKNSYIETLFHRKRIVQGLNLSQSYRIANNSPIQGTSADIIKLAMVQIDAALKKEKLKSFISLQIHDELVLNVPEKEREIVSSIVVKKMTNCVSLDVPLLVKTKICSRYWI